MMTKVACPKCDTHIESSDPLIGVEIICPGCHELFTPRTAISQTAEADAKRRREPPPMPPSAAESPQTRQLGRLRLDTAYPQVRSFIEGTHWLGMIGFGVSALVFAGRGFDGDISAIGLFIASVVAGLAWVFLYKPIASLLVDIADACIAISRR